jgi:cytochrome c oxidase subunit 2
MMRDLAKAATIALLAPGMAIANGEARFGFQAPQTPVAHEIYDLHLVVLGIVVVIALGVFGVISYAMLRHRRSLGHQAKQFEDSKSVQILWTAIPLLIVVGLAFPATRTVIVMKDTSSPDMTIKVTGYQWKWRYDYLGEDVSFYSDLSTAREQIENKAPKGENYLLEVDNPMVVPVGKKVRILVTASDVIHSWWVPAFGVKQDAIPGFVRDSWFKVDTPGIYRGQCAELCGKEHGFMPIVVEVKTKDEYAQWMDGQKKKMAAAGDDPNKAWDVAELVARGEKVYAANCAACHQPTGKGAPPAFPALDGSKIVTGPKAVQIKTVLNGVERDGKPTAMVSWKQLSDTDIASVITYTRNSWGNKTGEAVQPSEIKAARQ